MCLNQAAREKIKLKNIDNYYINLLLKKSKNIRVKLFKL